MKHIKEEEWRVVKPKESTGWVNVETGPEDLIVNICTCYGSKAMPYAKLIAQAPNLLKALIEADKKLSFNGMGLKSSEQAIKDATL